MMGRLVNRAKNNQVQHPPPTLRARKAGTIARRDNKRALEKLSEPAPSAGKGAFLMVGYYIIVIGVNLHSKWNREKILALVVLTP